MEIWESKPPGTLWATPGLLRYSNFLLCMFSLTADCYFVIQSGPKVGIQ